MLKLLKLPRGGGRRLGESKDFPTGTIDAVNVLLDRRFLPPGAKPGATSDPGQRERRDIYDELQQRGFVMIRLW